MKYNDLSNRQAPSFLFRVEDFLIEYQDTSSKDKVLNVLIGKFNRAKLNNNVALAINNIYRLTDYTVGLVCFEEAWLKYPSSVKNRIVDTLPISGIHIVSFPKDIEGLINSGEYTYYVDNDLEQQSIVGSTKGITLEDLSKIIFNKRGARYTYE